MPRVGLTYRGVVQGVGLRPSIFRLAHAAGVSGFVRNEGAGVRVEVQGTATDIARFERSVQACVAIEHVERGHLPERDEGAFRIEASVATASADLGCAPDLAPCSACLAELADPHSRRAGHAFIACAGCGPRFSILEELPYDRGHTTMARFALCPTCSAEYDDPGDRRFHAQSIACAACGPSLRFEGPAASADPLAAACALLADGGILALRGVGGFQLLVVADDEIAVARLRRRKHRPDKPFAVLFADLEALEHRALPSADERRLLGNAAAPIVLVRPRADATLAPSVARGRKLLGAMLPASPLHRLLSVGVSRPLVCTSGNRAGEPLCTTDAVAVASLGGIYDGMLTHDRPIVRALDDSVLRVAGSAPIFLRRARGYLPASVPFPSTATIVALGGHLKSVAVVTTGRKAWPTPHLGDLDHPDARDRLERAVLDLLGILHARPTAIACDMHPDYGSTWLAERLSERLRLPLVRVQHHHAHVASVAAEHALVGPMLGLAWDGTGLGDDGASWGGEALRVEGAEMVRVGSLQPFAVPAGEAAARDPGLVAACLLHSLGRSDAIARRLSPELAEREGRARPFTRPTTSVGRLFDAVAALLGLAVRTTYEAEAAMALEEAADATPVDPYAVALDRSTPIARIPLGPLVDAIFADLDAGISVAVVSARFHETLAAMAVEFARHVGLSDVVLAGGCFQNARLLERATARLTQAGYAVYAAREFPPNDGGLALGQAWVAAEVLGVSRDSG